MCEMLSHFAEDADWPKILPQVAAAYNSSVHSTTGFTPFQMAHGAAMRTVTDAEFDFVDLRNRSYNRYLEKLKMRLEEVHRQATEKIQTEQAGRTVEPESNFQVGDTVWCRNFLRPAGVRGKLEQKFEGPYEVMQVKPPDYVIKKGKKKRLVHGAHLKRQDSWRTREIQEESQDDTEDDAEPVGWPRPVEQSQGSRPPEDRSSEARPPEEQPFGSQQLSATQQQPAGVQSSVETIQPARESAAGAGLPTAGRQQQRSAAGVQLQRAENWSRAEVQQLEVEQPTAAEQLRREEPPQAAPERAAEQLPRAVPERAAEQLPRAAEQLPRAAPERAAEQLPQAVSAAEELPRTVPERAAEQPPVAGRGRESRAREYRTASGRTVRRPGYLRDYTE